MEEIETKFTWKSQQDDESGYTFVTTTDERNALRVFQYPTGFWGLMVNGTEETGKDGGRGVLGSAKSAIEYAEKYGDEIAAEQITNEK